MPTNPYPRLAAKAWATLRNRAGSSPTTKFTPEMVAALMNLSSAKNARDNVTWPMQQLGLIDEDGSLTKRGHKWRVNSSVTDACQEILEEVYPDDLSGLVDDEGNPNRKMVSDWFQRKGYGKSNANRMAVTYVTVASTVNSEPHDGIPGTVSKPPKTQPKGNSQEPPDDYESLAAKQRESAPPPVTSNGGPTVHIDIQIHIPVDATPEQIDQIFSSMARHLYTT